MHRPDLRERLVGRASRLGNPVLDAGAGAPQRTSKDERRTDDEGHDGERRCSKARVGDRQEDDAPDQEQRLAGKLREVVAQDGL